MSINSRLGFDGVLQMVDKEAPYFPITVVPTHSVLPLPTAVSVIVARPELCLYAKDPESGDLIQVAGPLEPSRAEQKALAASLSLLENPTPGMVVEGEEFRFLFQDGWWFFCTEDRDAWPATHPLVALPVLRALVKHGAATVRLPQQEEGELNDFECCDAKVKCEGCPLDD